MKSVCASCTVTKFHHFRNYQQYTSVPIYTLEICEYRNLQNMLKWALLQTTNYHFVPSFQFYWLGVLSMEQKVFPIKAHKSGHSFLRVTKPPFLSTPPFWSISNNLPIKYRIPSCKHFQVNLSTNHIFNNSFFFLFNLKGKEQYLILNTLIVTCIYFYKLLLLNKLLIKQRNLTWNFTYSN